MKKLDNYLQEIQIKGYNISERAIVELIVMIIITIITIVLYFSGSKRNLHIESMLKKITGKKYFVRILKNTKEPNAFCFGGLGNSIFITSGLMDLLNEREIISVCLHEIGHITNYDTITSAGISLSSLGIAALIWKTCVDHIYNFNGKAKIICGFIASLITVIIIKEAPAIMIGKLHEFRADRYASKYGYGKDLISALKKIEKWIKDYKFKTYGEETKFEAMLNKIGNFLDVHPSFENRVKKLFEYEDLYVAVYDKNTNQVKKICKQVLSQEV